jgi:putative phosphoserine phosphatase/1-acylglycerol-3-phosphate O-acyltransferase
MASAFGTGLGIGLVIRSRRDAVNLTISMGSEAALGLAGIRVRVWGQAHLWERRPAVFIYNHQSRLDGLIVMKLLRGDVAGGASEGVAGQPGFGQLAWLANMAFIDGHNGGRPAPPWRRSSSDGRTVSPSPCHRKDPGPRHQRSVRSTRKHSSMAVQGGVPIIPMVIRNAGELLWRGSVFMRSGTLDVAVLPP